MFLRNFSFLISGEGSFSTVYLGESIAQQGGWVAIKVVDKIDLLKTKKIGNPGCDPDQVRAHHMFSRILNFPFVIGFLKKKCLFNKNSCCFGIL